MGAAQGSSRRAEKLALLVGANPLPNYLAAVILEPREVVLIYSPETTEPRDRLRAALKERDDTVEVTAVCIDDATDARKIRDTCGGLEVDHLHYSGGTKPMAAHARMACKLDESQASYLDEWKGILRFDDHFDISLDQYNLGLTLDLLLKLHGSKRKSQQRVGAGTTADIDALAKAALTPGSSHPAGSDGRWLEDWVAQQVRLFAQGCIPDVGVHCTREKTKRDFEIDVALVRGHRLFVVSCTTAKKHDRCKAKLFEVAMRARQMGGDLARCAVVSLLDGTDQKGQSYVELLRGDIASVWGAPNVPRVFGLADLREWAGITGASNHGTLQEWLDS